MKDETIIIEKHLDVPQRFRWQLFWRGRRIPNMIFPTRRAAEAKRAELLERLESL